nr:hypothetical protein [Corynebacterium lactis]
MSINEATPPWVADALVRRRADGVYRWSVAGGVAAAFYSFFSWLSVQTPGKDLLIATLGQFGAWVAAFIGIIFLVVLGFSVRQVLQTLRDRALYAKPGLSRSAADIHTMHLWPVRNISGPVAALAESGVSAALGPGRFVWYLTCILWPVAIGWFFFADIARTQFQAGIVTVLAFVATAVTARLLALALAPEDHVRAIPAAHGDEESAPAFWSKGIIKPERPSSGETPFEGTAGNFVDDYYR